MLALLLPLQGPEIKENAVFGLTGYTYLNTNKEEREKRWSLERAEMDGGKIKAWMKRGGERDYFC